MAVWIFAYGRNGLAGGENADAGTCLRLLNSIPLDETKILDSMTEATAGGISPREHYTRHRADLEAYYSAMPEAEYRAYLESIKRPYIPVHKLIDHFIADGEQQRLEWERHFRLAYEQFESGRARSVWEMLADGVFTNSLCNFKDDSLRVVLRKDLIWITGPFAVFSVYGTFLNGISRELRKYYHAYFKSIFRAFGSEFILYAHEWSGLDDEEDVEFDLAKLRQQSNWEATGSESLYKMDRFYFEGL